MLLNACLCVCAYVVTICAQTHLQSVSLHRQQRHRGVSAPSRPSGPGAIANPLGFCIAGAASGISHQKFVDSVKQSALISSRFRRHSELSSRAASEDPFSSEVIDDFDDFIARRNPSRADDATSPLPRVFASPLARNKVGVHSNDRRVNLAAQRGFWYAPGVAEIVACVVLQCLLGGAY